jgi:hypothetical protein
VTQRGDQTQNQRRPAHPTAGRPLQVRQSGHRERQTPCGQHRHPPLDKERQPGGALRQRLAGHLPGETKRKQPAFGTGELLAMVPGPTVDPRFLPLV